MKAYLIKNEKVSGLSTLNSIAVNDLSTANYSERNQNNLKNDKEYTLELRGYPLSNFELSIYYRHYLAWQNFEQSDEDYALIIENVQAIHFTDADLNEIVASFDPKWDVVFPFNGFRKKEKENPSFLLGFRWGTDAYFINRNCLPKLLSLKIISLPVDEQLLLFNRQGQLNIQHENDESNLFSFGDDSVYDDDCNQSKLDQIFKINLWSQKDLKSIRTMISDLSRILEEREIAFFISEGTLLGYVRHKGIMPWDDDVDISVGSLDIERLIEAINSTEKYRITKWFWGKNKIEYYKISNKESNHVRNLPYGFPFIDIWIYNVNYNHIIYNHGFKVPFDFIFPIKRITFELADVNIPNKPIEYLNLKYQDWQEKITVYRWCHKKERPSLFPLSAKISVNETGMMRKSY